MSQYLPKEMLLQAEGLPLLTFFGLFLGNVCGFGSLCVCEDMLVGIIP